MFTTAAIALGGNVGEVSQVFLRALWKLDQQCEVQLVSRSRNFQTRPMGDHAGGTFTNSVALLQTSLTAPELLKRLQDVELEFGRERTVQWGPRTLDIDLISYGHSIVAIDPEGEPDSRGTSATCHHSPLESYRGSLLVPHPGAWYRRFVLDPWCDVSPNWRHPVLGETVRELQQRILKDRLLISALGLEEPELEQFQERIQAEELTNRIAIADSPDANADIVFDFRPAEATSRSLRSIMLPGSPVGMSMAISILHAALDEPVPLSE